MSKLFGILKDLHLSSMDTGDYTAEDVEKAEQAVKDLVLELIGNDEVEWRPINHDTYRAAERAAGANILRQALRQKVEDL